MHAPLTPPGTTLSLSNVRKSYGQFLALDDVSFEIKAGEFVGLLGPNGAGKSTLFQIVAGLFAPDAGQVQIFGQTYRNSGSAILRRLGVVFQARSVDLEMSVQANLRFHGGLFGLYGQALRQRIDELAEQFGFGDQLKRPVRTLSGGQQRRVEIARALLNAPDLLLMDEPSVGLDTTARHALVAHVRSLTQSSGVSVLWATHLVDEVNEADRIFLLAKGKMKAEGTPAEVAAVAGTDTLTQAYVALTGARPRPAGEVEGGADFHPGRIEQ